MSEKWRWYVYELIDPRTDTVFYVGKGCGRRIDSHEAEARRGICSKKTNKINEIRASGLEIKKQKVAFFWDEQAAYDHETDVIAQYGLQNLTNVMAGGQVAWDRRLLDRSQQQQKPKPLIDWFRKNEGKCESVFSAFADWFRLGLHKGEHKISLSSKNPSISTNIKITEMIHNEMLPILWKLVCQCEQSMEQFALRMKPYGIEVNHGRP